MHQQHQNLFDLANFVVVRLIISLQRHSGNIICLWKLSTRWRALAPSLSFAHQVAHRHKNLTRMMTMQTLLMMQKWTRTLSRCVFACG